LSKTIRSCAVCGSPEITTAWADARHATTTCEACGCVIAIEFDPPGEVGLRGRIEVLFDPSDDDSSGVH
jgi:hypothetical protein